MQILFKLTNSNRHQFLVQIFRTFERQKHQSSVDVKEVEHHSKLADVWWNPHGPLQGLHSLNTIRVPFIRDGLTATGRTDKQNIHSAKPLENVKILEIGCGAGILTEQLARIHANIVAIDPSEVLIQTARDHLSKYPADRNLIDRIDYRIESIEEHNSRTNTKYDAIVVSEVLEHVVDKEAFLKSCIAPLSPGGSIFITTFNKTALAWLSIIAIAEYVVKVVPKGTHDWNMFIPPLETQRLLEQYGCSTVLCHGFAYTFVKNKWMWTKNTQFSYALQAVKSSSAV